MKANSLRNTREWYDLLAQFENDIRNQSGMPSLQFDREANTGPKSAVYCHGLTNQIFLGYMAGYANGKAAERLGLYDTEHSA